MSRAFTNVEIDKCLELVRILSDGPYGGKVLRNAVAIIEQLRDTIQRRADTYRKPNEGWVCFHCGERFIEYVLAREHFGEGPDSYKDLAARVERLKTHIESDYWYLDKEDVMKIFGWEKK